MNNLDDVAKDILAQANQQRAALAQLLDNEINRVDRLLVSRVRMGGNEGYVGSVTLEWLKNHVDFATNLPLLRERIDEKGKLHIDEETIELLTQRPIDHSRQFPMAQYILFHQSHKFPAILAVMTSPWVDDPTANEWANGRATVSTARFDPLSSDGDTGLLTFPSGSTLYALDGQHRLLAIKGALEFIETGTLQEWDKDRLKPRSTLNKSEVLQKTPGITEVSLQKIRHERIGIEILPAVMQDETREEARRRVRRIFVHVNRTAVNLPKGVLTALDEDSGFRIIGRQVATTHPLFVAPDGKSRVEMERPNLPAKGSDYLTTLEAIANACELYLQDQYPYTAWRSTVKGLIPNRPEDDQLAKGRAEFTKFIDMLAALPCMQKVMAGYNPADYREFGDGDGHLLMRPVALEELAEAVAYCVWQKKMDLDAVRQRLVDLDNKGAFSHIDKSNSMWWGVQTKQAATPTIKNQRRRSATNLMIYLLGGFQGDQERLDALREELLVDRTTPPPNERIIGWEGKEVKESDFNLPTAY
ncbi:DGQHR domain-containing protein [Mycolicibacterium elephantis]|uniref:DGQHR domain-containing protein n=1 Tax=Mycolicibacterium elephantis TaxID=81858 RepID=UPI0009EF195F|nr:DGQHR domain-containing protein [Mycolicibacterium elephantis]